MELNAFVNRSKLFRLSLCKIFPYASLLIIYHTKRNLPAISAYQILSLPAHSLIIFASSKKSPSRFGTKSDRIPTIKKRQTHLCIQRNTITVLLFPTCLGTVPFPAPLLLSSDNSLIDALSDWNNCRSCLKSL